MNLHAHRAVLAAFALALASGCGGKAEPGKRAAGPRAVLITAVPVQPRSVEIYEEVVGSLENVMDPRIGAEVAGRVTRVLAFTGKKVRQGELLAEIDAEDFQIQSRADAAEVKRLQALLDNQERVVARQQKLVSQGFISQNALDEAIAQRTVLREQLSAARARAESTGRNLGKTRVLAPIDGEPRLYRAEVTVEVTLRDGTLVQADERHARVPELGVSEERLAVIALDDSEGWVQ